ncbi:unnamed protein product [Thlaspi arvense]|uniref:Zinc-ribbon domain-containing protein n=1 Tax=Thlaspi arvense TaxID=13288 RepID=A0AAU9SA32_THLAR|nr:unnamed protein product [Thlaspi arvense]
MMKKKKQSRSQSSDNKDPKKTLEPSSDSSPSPRLLSIFRSKLASGKDLKHMFRGMRSKTAPGLSSQSRIVRCPKCHKLLQEPIDATTYKCSGCNSILQAKRWELESNVNSIPEALLSNQNRSLSTEVESAEGGSKTPMRSTHNSRASPYVNKHETSDIRREWMRRADDFSENRESDVFASTRRSPYNSRSNVSEWTQHERRYEEPAPHQVPFYPASPSPSSAYDYGYSSSPFHGSQASASEQSYYHQHHQPNQFKQYGREGWLQESSAASPVRFPGETSDGKYNHWSSSQSQAHDHNLYESSSYATPHRSMYSERSYQADIAPLRSTSETSSEKSSLRDKKEYVRKRNHVVKRYVLPSAGGAPFATCSYCLELLQLPQVSLHGKHKRYQVRCGSCSGVLKFSSVREKADTVLDSPSFVASGTGFADESITRNNQDSASEDDCRLSSSDNGSGDRICKSNDAVILRQNLETFEDIKEDMIRSISSEFLDLKLEALQPQWKPSLNQKLREQQPASSDTIGETSRIHLEEAQSKKSTEVDDNVFERVGCDLEESENEMNEILTPEEMFGDGSGEFLVPVYKNERMSELSEDAERVAERSVSHRVEPLYKDELICETRVLTENARDSHEFDWEETREYGGESTLEEIMGDKPELHLERSQYIGDSVSDSNSSYGETCEDTSVKEDTEHISNTYSDAMSATPQSPLKPLVNDIRHPEQSGEATFTVSRIHEEQSKYDEYENISERQELDKAISDRVRCDLEESTRYETNETLDSGNVSEDGSVVSLKKASETFKTNIEAETGEERLVSHQIDIPRENVENSYERLEPLYLQGSVYAGERTWGETMGDRAALHLEEYESNYHNYRKPFEWTSEGAQMHEYELGTILEPEEDAQGRSESNSRGSFNDHEKSGESAVSEDAKPDRSQYEYENSSERQELSNTVFDIVRSEFQECRYESHETFEPSKMVGVGSAVSLEKASETFIGETGAEERSVSHQMAPQNKNVEISYRTDEPVYLEESGCASERAWAETTGDEAGLQLKEYQSNPHEWTSERAPTFRLNEYELGTVPEAEEDANGRSISSSTDSFNDHESSKERDVAHEEEEESWLVDENKTEELTVGGVMMEDRPSLHLEECGNESTKSEETFEWTERTPTFLLHESELGTMLEPDEDADGRLESSSTGSFNNYETKKVRAVFHEEELQVREMAEDRASLDLDKCENESIKSEETFEWTSERAPTFRLHEYELGTMLEPNNHADGRSETSSRGSFKDHEISKEREMNHEEEPRLVTDSRTEAQQVGEMAKDTVSLHLEEFENESMKLDETFVWTSGRALTFRCREYELGTMLEQDEDADGRSESSLSGSKERSGVMAEDGSSLHLERCENEKMVSDQALEARDDIFRLSLDDTFESERMTFHLEMSQDKQENLRHSSKQGEAEEERPEFGSRVSSEETMAEHLEDLQEEKEKSGLTSEPYAQFYTATEPCEIVGLRHALYQTQTSPLRSPLSSPIHTPIGSPLHYLMGSQMRSPMHSHIVSPLRSPINTSGSLSDVLFFGKKA